MNPLSIKALLNAYASRIRAPQGIVVQALVDAYIEVGIPCGSSDVSYTPTTKTATITAQGPKRIEMLMRKREVLRLLRESLRERDMPTDIL